MPRVTEAILTRRSMARMTSMKHDREREPMEVPCHRLPTSEATIPADQPLICEIIPPRA